MKGSSLQYWPNIKLFGSNKLSARKLTRLEVNEIIASIVSTKVQTVRGKLSTL